MHVQRLLQYIRLFSLYNRRVVNPATNVRIVFYISVVLYVNNMVYREHHIYFPINLLLLSLQLFTMNLFFCLFNLISEKLCNV